jgi:hypothetical protein
MEIVSELITLLAIYTAVLKTITVLALFGLIYTTTVAYNKWWLANWKFKV